MTSVADGVRRVGRRRADARSPEGSRDVADRELPAWPVLALLWGLPLWWMLGLLPFYLAIMSVAMVAYLIHRGRVELVPGVVPWAAFVVWMLPCAMMLDSLSRIVGFGLRFSQFAGVAVALVYLVNARRSIPVGRLLSGLTFTWCFIVVCGYLGMWWPDGVLTFTVGRLLPAPLLESEYVNDLVFPKFAEVQDPWGADEPFVRLLPAGHWPHTKHVVASNHAVLQLAFDEHAGRVIVTCVIDNLTKGTAGGAVQSMNIALGLPETAGLEIEGVAP